LLTDQLRGMAERVLLVGRMGMLRITNGWILEP